MQQPPTRTTDKDMTNSGIALAKQICSAGRSEDRDAMFGFDVCSRRQGTITCIRDRGRVKFRLHRHEA